MTTPVGFTLPLDFTYSTTTEVPCTTAAARPPKPMNFSDRWLYFRMTLLQVYYLSDYGNFSSVQTQQLNWFLQDSLTKDFQTWSRGRFFNLTLVSVQPPLWGQSAFNIYATIPGPGCTIVDFVANFTSNLTAIDRTTIVQGTYAKARSSHRGGGSLVGRFGSNPVATTQVGEVFYISPYNYYPILPVSPCVVFSNEAGCRNGGYCVSAGSSPSCVCQPGYEGNYCEITSGIFLQPEWPVYQIVLIAIAAVAFLAILVITICFCLGGPGCRLFPRVRSFDLDVARNRHLAPAYLNFPLPVVPVQPNHQAVPDHRARPNMAPPRYYYQRPPQPPPRYYRNYY